MLAIEKIRVAIAALQPINDPITIRGNDIWTFGKAFISASPTIILWHRERWCEGPVMTRYPQFARRHTINFFDQIWIVRCAETDIVWEHDGAFEIGVTVNRIDPPYYRNGKFNAFWVH